MNNTMISIDNVLQGVTEGDRKSIARAIGFAESRLPNRQKLLAGIHQHAGRAHIVGLTGVPGSGKSTLVGAIARDLRARGQRIGIVAVDPSSPFSGGAILGDRIRMTDLIGDPGVYIRSMATQGALGGLARSTLDVVDVLDASGFDVVIIETVGVGQDEVDVVRAAHTVVVVSAPGLGDEVQAMKAGVLEIADVHAISKCDKPDAGKTQAEIAAMLQHRVEGDGQAGWVVPVLATSAQNRKGIASLVNVILEHIKYLKSSGNFDDRLRNMISMRVLKIAEDQVRDRFLKDHRTEFNSLVDKTLSRQLYPERAARELLSNLAWE